MIIQKVSKSSSFANAHLFNFIFSSLSLSWPLKLLMAQKRQKYSLILTAFSISIPSSSSIPYPNFLAPTLLLMSAEWKHSADGLSFCPPHPPTLHTRSHTIFPLPFSPLFFIYLLFLFIDGELKENLGQMKETSGVFYPQCSLSPCTFLPFNHIIRLY